MNKKIFHMTLTHYPDYYNEPDYDRAQTLRWNEDNFAGGFSVYDLSDCPEDATIARDLFTAYDFIDAVKLGMNLYRQGYDGLELLEKIHKQED